MCPPQSTTLLGNADVSDRSSFDLPKDEITQAAYDHAKQHLHPDILAHSIRVGIYASALAQDTIWSKHENISLLLTACLFHDIGTADIYNTGPTRFEIEGADAAKSFLIDRGVSEEKAHEVWIAIAVHDTPQIAERISPLARFVRLGVLIDFKKINADTTGTVIDDIIMRAEQDYSRGEIEKVLGDTVVAQALKNPAKAPAACWPGNLLRAKLENPDWEGINKAF